jgi:hypothetical protein
MRLPRMWGVGLAAGFEGFRLVADMAFPFRRLDLQGGALSRQWDAWQSCMALHCNDMVQHGIWLSETGVPARDPREENTMTKDQQIVAWVANIVATQLDEIRDAVRDANVDIMTPLVVVLGLARAISDGTLGWDDEQKALIKLATGEIVRPTLH